MTLYRVLRPLTTGHVVDDVVDGNRFSPQVLKILLEKKALAQVRPPPLSELPGWEERAAKLATIGVVTAREFLETDDDEVRKLFNYKRTTTITKWKKQAEEWLHAEPGKKRK